MKTFHTGITCEVTEGCTVQCVMHGSNEAFVTLGEDLGSAYCELTFDFETFKGLITQGVGVLAEMNAKAEQEQAEYDERGDDPATPES